MQTTIPYKTCLSCGRTIRGRSDKKFCDDQCRNQYNNGAREDSSLVRTIQYFLRKNRRVLHSLLQDMGEERTVSRERLLELGFSFRYHTHCTSGHRHYCYDHWYRMLDEEQVLIGREVS
jgi:predicted nucleic acid-binding Zn ribbon protein